MLGRLFKFGIFYAPIGLVAVYFVSLVENQDPWLIGIGIYLVFGAIIGNIYVFSGGGSRRRKDK